MLRRVRPRTGTASGEDRFSALPDDLIHLIVRRLDTRTALSMAVLARRWAHIPHDLPELDFRVSDVLPPEYHRTVALRRRNMPRDTFLAETLDRLMARCEIDTISAFVDGITGLLEADGGPTDGDPRRRAKTLRLEFFQTHDGGYVVDRLIATAVGAWGVKDLEVVARQASCDVLQAPPYCFPHDHDCLKDDLRSLTLGNYCTLPPLHSYNALTTLVLKDMAASTPVGVYQRVFIECTRLQVLHLISCCCAQDCVTVDAPCSEIKELILDQCKFMAVELLHLPMLVSLACCLTDTCRIVFGSVPSLMHTNLTFATESWIVPQRCRDHFAHYIIGIPPTITNLVLRFTGLRRWMLPSTPVKPFLNLKELLVADLPANWNISWPRRLLMSAPSLEVLHIHVPCSEGEPTYGSMLMTSLEALQRHHRLEEFVITGFLQRHIWFLKYVVSVCTSLQRVILLKDDGHVRYNGLWDWEMVEQQACPWSDDDEMVVRRIIKSGCRPLVELSVG
ncbi:hypothetical protein D1007_03204 [Hordeum vulgare]|uniref:F-box domain-containing protein n=1 Tax=Hordeum vulgare subsp. vulgare TaxID=112509 RepID=A0A8I6WPG6_HORVV|nr:hypothetical protein D1007_03204 [Hordeum vulgare]